MVRQSRGFKIGPVKFACAMLTLLPLMTTLCTRLEAQTTASIRGTVRDEQGAVLPKATLTARQIDTNTTRTTVTGDAGEFYLPNLPAGKYLIKAELSGFAGVESTVELTIGREFELNLNLKLATVQSSVTVEEQITLLDTQHTVGEDIGIKEINDLPTLARD